MPNEADMIGTDTDRAQRKEGEISQTDTYEHAEQNRRDRQEYSAMAEALSSTKYALKASLEVIISAYEAMVMKEDPGSATVFKIGRDSATSTRTMGKALTGVDTSSAIVNRARAEAEAYLSTQPGGVSSDYGLQANVASESRDRAKNAEREMAAEDRKYEGGMRDEIAQTNLGEIIHSDNPLKSAELTGRIIRDCIPCGLRPLSTGDIELKGPQLSQLWGHLSKEWQNLKDKLESLYLGDQMEQDFCDLMSFFDGQCLPDLVALLALIGLMQLRYFSDFEMNWKSALNSLLAPFLTPIIAPFVVNIDGYLKAVVAPLVCVLDALEYQMGKIDVIDGVDKMKANERSYQNKKLEFYRRKESSLNKRLLNIKEERKNDQNEHIIAPKYFTKSLFSPEMMKRPSGKALAAMGATPSQNTEISGALPGWQDKWRTTYDEEINNIKKELAEIKAKKAKVNLKVDSLSKKRGGENYIANGRENVAEAQEKIKNFKGNFKSIINDVVEAGNGGIRDIEMTFEMFKTELQRLIMGRVSVQTDQIEIARTLQKFQRWISIINALIQIGNLMDKCKNGGDSDDAMGAFLASLSEGSSGRNNQSPVYSGTDSSGNKIMVVTPPGASLLVTSLDYDDITDEDLFGDVTIDDIQTTASYNDLNEAEEMNRKGLLLDIGNIDGKELKVQLKDAGKTKTSLDLKAEQSYAIIKNDFCSKSPLNFGSTESVKQWAQLL